MIAVRLLISRHLENFMAIYAAQNMHVAAERKGISQPALTKSLKLLEADLGTELFVRTSRGVEATPAGHLLHRYACEIDQQARFAGMDLPELANQLKGRLQIGVGPVLAATIFPSVIVEFHKLFPAMNVAIETGISNRLAEGLLRNEHDIIVAARPEESLGDDIHTHAVFSSDMVAICRKGHPLLDRQPVSIRDLAAYERIGFIGDREFEKKSGRIFGPHAETMQPHIETTSMAIMFGILAATDYFAIVSDVLLPRVERDGLSSLATDHDLWRIDIEMMCKRSFSTSRPVKVMKDLLTQSGHQALPTRP